LLSGKISEPTSFSGDDLRRVDPKFQPPRLGQYLRAVDRLDVLARERFGKRVIHLALRWVLDEPGVGAALWGARRPDQLDALAGALDFTLDEPAKAEIDRILGRKTVWLGDAGAGSRMKLVLNSWLAALVEGTAEAALAKTLGVTLDHVAECLEGGPLDAPLVRSKLTKIAAADFDPEFSLAMAAKDVRLALQAEAQGSGTLPMLEALDRRWQRVLASGYGDRDVSVVYLGLAPAEGSVDGDIALT